MTFRIIIVLSELTPYWWGKGSKIRIYFALSLFLVLLTSVFNLLIPISFKSLVNNLLNLKKVFPNEIIMLLAYSFLWLGSQITIQLREIILMRPLQRAARLLSTHIFSHLHNLPMSFHLNRRTGALISIMERAQQSMPELFFGAFLYVFPTTLEICGAILILLLLYKAHYAVIVSIILVFYLLFTIVAIRWTSRAQRLSNEKDANANSRIVDSLINIEAIKYLGTKDHEINTCDHLLHLYERAEANKKIIFESVHLGQGIIMGLGLFIVTWIAVDDIKTGLLTIGDLILINGYFMQFVYPLSHFGHILQDIQRGITNMEDALNILGTPTAIVKTHKLNTLRDTSIEFKNVSFNYNGRKIINNLSFKVNAGQTLAIVGSTGAGKSTIARLISRLYTPQDGQILLGKYPLNAIREEELSRLIGVVSQDITLFNDTLLYNLTYGLTHITQKEVDQAIEEAQLKEFISSLPEGYITKVGERGLKLSGGEKQRLALARLFLRKPSIFILDEATSALDTETERHILNILSTNYKDTTRIVIAHRLSTLTNAEQILVFSHGKIVERGTHSSLLSRNGLYTVLWEQQHG
ncbi:MAG: hypothetical protein BGO76_07115 [Caedibacter sp. 38-128]|nr:ABC transporter ATP-binding protein/permease [Holosporales bacterium]OJX04782.1 MAG: hypothetical protein BGO76_07115 [Caedibacter sp. 38-128]